MPQRDKTASQGPVVVEFTKPVRLMDIGPPIEIVVCKLCGAAVPVITIYEPAEPELQPPSKMERICDARTRHADWHRRVDVQ